MDITIFIAILGGLINALLSVVVPTLLKGSEQNFLKQIEDVFKTNRKLIITSSLIVAITIYLALQITPDVQSVFTELTGMRVNPNPSLCGKPPLHFRQSGLRNLANLGRTW